MYVGLKQPRGDGERYVTPARAAAKETTFRAEEPVVTPGRIFNSSHKPQEDFFLGKNCSWTLLPGSI